MTGLLPPRSIDDIVDDRRRPFDEATIDAVRPIVTEVICDGEPALRRWAQHFDELGTELFFERAALEVACDALPERDRGLLERLAGRIRTFAAAQHRAITDVDEPVPGGRAGHTWVPCERVGCYAPGGRYPLPSSVLMTVIPARVAGVQDVWVATPRPSLMMLGAAFVAGADGVLAAGGPQAIAALTRGVGPLAPRDMIVGPGNAYVTAAKYLVSDRVGIDGLAGPSELVVLAAGKTSPAVIAADLIAQAEHDPLALPVLVTTDAGFPDAVRAELAAQLGSLATAETARAALARGAAIVVDTFAEAAAVCNTIAPEHLHVCTDDPENVCPLLTTYGALFVGAHSAEVLGDYGAGPNHVLPTGGTARYTGGLSVYTFLAARTWLRIDDPKAARGMVLDAVDFAGVEGLEGHVIAGRRRLTASS